MPRWGCPTRVQQTKEQTMTPLRGRMIEDMKLAGLAVKTQEVYQQAVRGLAKHYRRPPDQRRSAGIFWMSRNKEPLGNLQDLPLWDPVLLPADAGPRLAAV